jgi:Rieske Fe-S protein
MDQSRRQFLKIMAAAPLILPFGLTASPIMRFLKPTMSPLGFFDPSDQPASADGVSFTLSDFPEPWTCIPFMFRMKITEFNPEQQEIREIPAFIIRLQGNEIAAYSRICTRHGCILNYVANPSNFNCGCASTAKDCCCSYKLNNPVLICPVDLSMFDLAREGLVVRGPAPRPPRKFELDRQGNKIAIVCLEGGVIR